LVSVRAPVGPTNVCSAKSCIGRGLAAIRPLCGTETLFLLYMLRTNEALLAGKGTGSTFSAISGDDLKALDVVLPPAPEQRRIVAKIEELFSQLDAGVEELKKAKAQLKRYRQSVLKAAFEGKLTEEWRRQRANRQEPTETVQELLDRIREERKKALGKKYKEPPPLDTFELPDLPEGWAWASLDELAAKITDGEHIRPDTVAEGVPFLSAKDVRDDGVSFGTPLFVSARDADTFRRRCDPDRGDIWTAPDLLDTFLSGKC
jgi:type I restriction enzyme S subunit